MSVKTSISWADITINPITGCTNGCVYCYAAAMAHRFHRSFVPDFHPDKLQAIRNLRGKGKRVFLNSMSDWLSEGVEPDWIAQIVAAVWERPEHHFLVLTKRPERILELIHCIPLPQNLWWGVSVTKQQNLWRIAALRDALPGVHKFVSFEPLHGPINVVLAGKGIEWVIVGAESGNRIDKIAPKPEWIREIGSNCWANNIPMFVKDNAEPYCKDLPWTTGISKEFPEGLR